MKVRARIVEPRPSGATAAVNEVWRLRRGVPFTVLSADQVSAVATGSVIAEVQILVEVQAFPLGTLQHRLTRH